MHTFQLAIRLSHGRVFKKCRRGFLFSLQIRVFLNLRFWWRKNVGWNRESDRRGGTKKDSFLFVGHALTQSHETGGATKDDRKKSNSAINKKDHKKDFLSTVPRKKRLTMAAAGTPTIRVTHRRSQSLFLSALLVLVSAHCISAFLDTAQNVRRIHHHQHDVVSSVRGTSPGWLQARKSSAGDDPFGDHGDDSAEPWSGFLDDDDDDEDYNGSWDDDEDTRDTTQASTDDLGSEKPSHFFSKKTLEDPSFRTPGSRLDLLFKGAEITRPSRIQSMAWPVVLEGKHCIIADQTGSGKTLAYLIPLLQRALEAKSGPEINGAPRVLILAPTAELADQTKTVCAKLSKLVPFSTLVVTAMGKYSTSIRDQIRILQRQPVDVLISTPGRISTILRTRNSGLDLSYLQSIVLDEVDVLLLDETFGPQLRTVGAAAPADNTQFVFVTATLPDAVVKTVETEFPGVVRVKGPGLHRVAPTVKERLIDVSVPSKYNRDSKLCFDIKAKQLLRALRQTRCRRTLVFCNTVDSCRQVENLLGRKDRRGQIYDIRAYHNAMTPEARNENLAVFAHGAVGQHGKGAVGDAVDSILVCTDRAARGVDFDAAPVDHVILFDFPKDASEYVRRVGRTARAGRTGTSTVFAYGWQLPIARKVMGSKLDSFTVAVDEEEGADEYLGGVKGRLQQGKKGADQTIRGNIAGGTQWGSKTDKTDI
jgi:ATP-dependent RNA helicase DDX18/HAS1